MANHDSSKQWLVSLRLFFVALVLGTCVLLSPLFEKRPPIGVGVHTETNRAHIDLDNASMTILYVDDELVLRTIDDEEFTRFDRPATRKRDVFIEIACKAKYTDIDAATRFAKRLAENLTNRNSKRVIGNCVWVLIQESAIGQAESPKLAGEQRE